MKTNRFQLYLDKTFEPAQQWAASEAGRTYIAENIPSLDFLRSKENDVLAATYAIYINYKAVYAGQSLRAVKRLYCHAWNISNNSEVIFGIKPEEIHALEFRLCSPPIYNEKSRLAAEEALIKSIKPVLQPYYNIPGLRPDLCLPRQARREAMINAGVISNPETE